jgi:hypothetical protein
MISREMAAAVKERAADACEYCRLPQFARRLRFPIDHINAHQHRGPTVLENLALCCGRCNRHKGPNVAGVDPVTGTIVRLYHPRKDIWHSHFRWDGPRIVGMTEIGRVTVEVLNINHPEDLAIRSELIEDGVFPPATDARQ